MKITVSWSPCRLVNTNNKREHKFARSGRAAKHRQGILHRLGNMIGKLPERPRPPFKVTITRLAPRKLDLDDNLNNSAKSIRDGVADALGVDDGDAEAIRFQYAQEVSSSYGVRVEIRSGAV